MAKELKKTSEEVIKEMEKRYGKNSVISLSTDSVIKDLEIISSGSLGLDKATGLNGLPLGRIVEVMSAESCGKTTLATHIMVEGQKKGKVAFLDAEHTFDFNYAQKIGLNKEGLTYAAPDDGEMAFDIMKALLATGEYRVIVLDSVAAAIPREQHEGETGHSRMARLAALMSMEVPKIVPLAANNNCLVVFLNQYRSNIGGYGNPLMPAGGLALKFFCSIRLEMTKTVIKEEGYNKTTVKVSKNKCAPPWGECSFSIIWGQGIDNEEEVIELAVEKGLLKKGGAGWFDYEGAKIQGVDKMKEFFSDNPELFAKIKEQLK